jgi:thiamine-monophosphate kinase
MNTSEDEVIARLRGIARSGAAAGQVRLGIGDDAAIFAPKQGHETILSSDWFIEGIHFSRTLHAPDAVGWKCLARALSDIAAMGGTPRCLLLNLALPSTHTREWLMHFLSGLRRASQKFGCPLAGGDTTQRRDILINVTVVGEIRKTLAIRRSGAAAGDAIFVSGTVGEADLGLALLRRSRRRPLRTTSALRKHLYPEPRVLLGKWLAEHRLATAMMDLSDGLSTDLSRLCDASGVGACIRAADLPAPQLSAGTGKWKFKNLDPVALALNGGDDYELLFTVPRHRVPRVPKTLRGVRLTHIGEITRDRRLALVTLNGEAVELQPRGWDPFRRDSK